MEEAPDPHELQVGIDTSVLINLVSGRRLGNLQELFGTVAVPGLVCAEVARGVDRFPVNRGILGASWLARVTTEDPGDLQLTSDLRRNLGGEPPENAGEAELIVLSVRYVWTALLEDRSGRELAIREGVHAVRLTTCAVAAAACGVMTVERAWGLHRGYHATNSRPLAIGITPAERSRFERAVQIVARLSTKLADPPWPQILRHPDLAPGQLDDVVSYCARGI